MSECNTLEHVRILGIPVNVVNLGSSASVVSKWAQSEPAKTVFVRDVASLMAAVNEQRLAQLHEDANLVVPDGTPLAWVIRLKRGDRESGRVAGADLVDALCQKSLTTGQSHYFFGGKPGVAEEMSSQLQRRYPGLKVAGTYSPPMRTIGPDFELDEVTRAEINHIRLADPDFIWVGISSPKQEYWMMKAVHELQRGVLIGVGAAFDYHSGAVGRAPRWMRDNGLEWAHRIYSEPRRLWRRYLLSVPMCIVLILIELAGVRLYSVRRRSQPS